MSHNLSEQRCPDVWKTIVSFEGSKDSPTCPDTINVDEYWALVEWGLQRETAYWELRTKTNLNYIERLTRSEHSVSTTSKESVHVLYGQLLSVLTAAYIHCEGRIQHTWMLHLAVNIVTTMLKRLTAYNNCILTQTFVSFFCHTWMKICLQHNTYIRLFVLEGLFFNN